jgi:hypothetical protein
MYRTKKYQSKIQAEFLVVTGGQLVTALQNFRWVTPAGLR